MRVNEAGDAISKALDVKPLSGLQEGQFSVYAANFRPVRAVTEDFARVELPQEDVVPLPHVEDAAGVEVQVNFLDGPVVEAHLDEAVLRTDIHPVDAGRRHGRSDRFSDLLGVNHERVRLWTFARAAAGPREEWKDDDAMALARALAP